MKLKLIYHLGNVNDGPPQTRAENLEIEVDDSFFSLNEQEKKAIIIGAGKDLLRPGEKVAWVDVEEELKIL